MALNQYKEMMTKQNTYYLLILSILISFGFFGSLSHLFSLALIILVYVEYTRSDNQNIKNFKSLILFFILSSCFFFFLFTSIFRNNLGELFSSLSPLLPIPFIGILIILHNGSNFKLSSKKLSQFSQISVLFSLILYLVLIVATDPNSIFYKFHAPRLTLFSGNPIPFSFCMLGLSIFCIANWQRSNQKNKLIAFLLFLIGSYFACFLSGTRGSLLSLILIFPIVIFYLSNKLKTSFFIIFTAALVGVLIFQTSLQSNLKNSYLNRIENGIETIRLMKNTDNSIWLRLDMWSAGINAFSEAPIFGHGIAERFIALKPHLKNSVVHYSHPHNDIFAGLISSGVIGGIAVLASLMSGVAAAISAPYRSSTKLYLALMLSCSTVVTGNVSTVLFNDICSAWLAFSTYLIWATDFKDESPNVEN